MTKEKSKSKCWKQEVKADEEKIEQAEKERDEAKKEAKVTRLVAIATGEAKAKAKDDLTRV